MIKNWKFRNNGGEESVDEPKFFTIEKSIDSTSLQGNKIYFYSDVTRESILSLTRQIDEATKQIKNLQVSYNLSKPPVIELHINSDGGDVFAGLAAVDKIRDNDVPIETYCEGMVASAATFISLAGSKRYITKNSFMLIHQIRSSFWGNYAQFKEEVENLDLLMEIIKTIYLKRTTMDSDFLDDILKRDSILGAEICMDYGLVDKIL